MLQFLRTNTVITGVRATCFAGMALATRIISAVDRNATAAIAIAEVIGFPIAIRTVQRSNLAEACPIEPSGAVKGWAIEQAAGIHDFCVNAGGDVFAGGTMEPGKPWRIGLRHPLDGTKVMAVVGAQDLAVATYAEYERGAHIVPTREGAAGELLSVTVVGPDITLADAFATAAFAMGADGIAWAARQPGFGVFAVDRAGTTHHDAEMARVLL